MAEPTTRALISYSHLNDELCNRISKALRSLNLRPWSDKDLLGGRPFREGVQAAITHAHVFVPILTPQSHTRRWVHQEIGYAVAMRVPCVPICVGASSVLPDGIIATLHAVELDSELTGLKEKLGHVQFDQLIKHAGRQWAPPFAWDSQPEERAATIEALSDEAFSRLKRPCCVRTRSLLSSFSLPDEECWHPAWEARYAGHPRVRNSYELFRRERQALGKHAAAGGLKMIINPFYNDVLYGPGAKRARLSILVHFLESLNLPDEAVAIALVEEQPPDRTIAVGDWFIADSLGDRISRGVNQTIFTTHAPTVSRRIAEFDAELARLLAAQNSSPRQSLIRAIDQLRGLIQDLPAHPAWSGY